MAWELLAIWAIVSVTVIWFMRDEKRRRANAEIERASRYYVHAGKYRHLTAAPLQPMPPKRQAGLSDDQRAFLKALQQA